MLLINNKLYGSQVNEVLKPLWKPWNNYFSGKRSQNTKGQVSSTETAVLTYSLKKFDSEENRGGDSMWRY